MICVPTSLDQPVGAAFGAQAGLAKLSAAIKQGGFARVRKATETPLNMILEARPYLASRKRCSRVLPQPLAHPGPAGVSRAGPLFGCKRISHNLVALSGPRELGWWAVAFLSDRRFRGGANDAGFSCARD
jgi:hypothetical protein